MNNLEIILILFFICPLFAAGWKWQIKWYWNVPWTILCAATAILAVNWMHDAVPFVPAFAVGLLIVSVIYLVTGVVLLFFFFRDPKRTTPVESGTLFSPADGTVVYIKKIVNAEFPFAVKNNRVLPLAEFAGIDMGWENGVQIGIGMNFLNVHVNRSPMGGVVCKIVPNRGKFLSLKHISALLENERVTTLIGSEIGNIAIVQIASRLVRRIVCFVKETEPLNAGQKIGMIRFGSQVDILLPWQDDMEILISQGQQIKAGLTRIARYSRKMK